jgi:hypothetical protein
MDRKSMVLGAFLIGIGAIFLILNLIPGVEMGKTWPLIFYILGGAFFLPGFILPDYRQALAALFIPGSILLALALIFTYNVLTGDYAIWAYAWLLLPAGVGFGLLLAGGVGNWGKGVRPVGLWMIIVDVGLFAMFATLFGKNDFIGLIGPVLIIATGASILIKVFLK